jgi:hypothetical protein
LDLQPWANRHAIEVLYPAVAEKSSQCTVDFSQQDFVMRSKRLKEKTFAWLSACF